ncbi:MAG: hypothetical protein ABUS79_24380, partial [Pseudomonadota bacterium]
AMPQSCPTAGQTCFVNCQTSMGMCIPGGTKGPGEACATNNDCMPGTQCFNYGSIPGCAANTKICLKFCASDGQCTAATGATPDAGTTGDAGAPPLVPSACKNPVSCSSTVTSYRTCTFACDPRGDGTTGCPAGLFCFLYADLAGGPESPDCNCRDPKSVGTDGATCTTSTDCAPGFLCNEMGGVRACRQLCKMGATGECGTKGCMNLVNNDVFGVCI